MIKVKFLMLTIFSGGTQSAKVPADETNNYDQIKLLPFINIQVKRYHRDSIMLDQYPLLQESFFVVVGQ
jgi:hypothetical protein